MSKRLSHWQELIWGSYFVGFHETFDVVHELETCLNPVCSFIKLYWEETSYTFLLEQPNNLIFELQLCHLDFLGWMVQSYILIHPHSALLIFIYEDHLTINLECPKPIKQPFEPNNGFFHEVEYLKEGHFGDWVKSCVKCFNGHLDDRTLI